MLGETCSMPCAMPLEPALSIAGCIVIVVALETFQLKVADSLGVIVSGVAMKELMVGREKVGETFLSLVSVDGAGDGADSSAVS